MTRHAALLVLALFAVSCGSETDDAVANETPTSELAEAPTTTDSEAQVESADDTNNEDAETTDTEAQTATTEAAVVDSEPSTDAVSLEVDCTGIGPAPVGLETGTITSGGVDYAYQWTVPSSYDGNPIPVVLDFHGIGSNGAQQAVFSGWAAKAEAEGFLSVQPTGISVPGDDRASWELPQFDSELRDDVQMVRDLLSHVSSNICIDPTRVYSTGMSNGGFFTAELVCDLSERIAAAVSVAGVTHDDSCEPSRPVPYLAFHGRDDTTVPFRGGGETTLEGGGGAFFEQVMPDEFAEFAADFGCAESTESIVTAEVTLTSWTGCDEGVEMGFYAIDGAGHTWPGSVISSAIPSLGVTNMDIDATALAWEFFERHTLADG